MINYFTDVTTGKVEKYNSKMTQNSHIYAYSMYKGIKCTLYTNMQLYGYIIEFNGVEYTPPLSDIHPLAANYCKNYIKQLLHK